MLSKIESGNAVKFRYSNETNTMTGAKLYTYNRLKYLSYYYDSDLLMYDLGSRFYDPVPGRFVNADAPDILSIQGDLYNMNLYAYCDNNPVMRKDGSGEFWLTVGIMAVGVVSLLMCDKEVIEV